MQSPGVMSATRPPLAAMIRPIRSTAGSNVACPVPAASRSAFRPVMPAGSRTRPISAATRAGEVVVSSQGSPGRMTSPPISWASPVPSLRRSSPAQVP